MSIADAWEVVVETEPEFDVDERDSWYALHELRVATCPHCGNLKLICGDPGGLTGEGFHITQHTCYPTMISQAARRRLQLRYEKAQPDLQGFLPADGVILGVALVDDGSEDLLGLGEREQLLPAEGPAGVDQAEQDHQAAEEDH